MPSYLDQIRVTDSRAYVWDVDSLSWVEQTTGAFALTPSAPDAATVGVTSAEALASNASRKGLELVNTSDNTISIAFGADAAVLNSGITLMAGGGSFSMSARTFTTEAVNAIASGASSNLAIQEYT